MDPLTYKHPRTMEEAFGHSGPLVDPDEQPMDIADKIVLWAAPVVVIFIVVLIALESV